MKKIIFLLSLISCSLAFGKVRLKDIIQIKSIRDNQLVGYGLVVGLGGTGDNMNNSPYTKESLMGMLERLGINVRDQANNMKAKNIAAVMVTATLPPFSRQGNRIDISVSTMGDAKSLLGGTLLVTPLMGADGDVYAVAQGPVITGGFAAEGKSGSSVTKGVPTSGKVPSGAIVEKELGHELSHTYPLTLSLNNPDITTAKRVEEVINKTYGSTTARALDPQTIRLEPSPRFSGDVMAFLADMEQLTIEPDQPARIIIDEQNGVIVMGANVKISPVAVSHGSLSIKIQENQQVSQPNALSSGGSTEKVDRSSIDVQENSDKKMAALETGPTLKNLVDGLNSLGIAPRDMILILQNIKAAGALQAEIEVR